MDNSLEPAPTIDGPARTRSSPSRAVLWFRGQVLRRLARVSKASLSVSDPLQQLAFGDEESELQAEIFITDLDFYRQLALYGSLGAAESYMQGAWRSSTMTNLVRILLRNRDVLDAVDGAGAKIKQHFLKFWHYLNKNSLAGSRRNIARHYDLGNDFFRLFLDQDYLMYSAAMFTPYTQTLEAASALKMKAICEKLELKPTDHLLEIGTGWGGLAVYAAKHYGCRVTTTTISKQQYEYAKRWVKAEKLEHRVVTLKQDYRELQGRFDKLVSIEMIEAVGHNYLDIYLKRCCELLIDSGLALIQSITIADQRYQQALKSVDFIKRYIFPGSFIPCASHILNRVAANTDMRLINLEDFGRSYAATLNAWRERFWQQIEAVREQGFDDRFIRMWDFYLCYCEGGFLEQSISDVQLLFAKPKNRRAEWLALQK